MAKNKKLPDGVVEMAEIIDINQSEPKGWRSQFKLTTDGGVKRGSIYNIKLIMENDENLNNIIAYNEFSEQLVKPRDVPALDMHKGYWSDSDDVMVRSYIEDKYNLLFSKDNISDAIISMARLTTINPAKERIEAVEWDGVKRAERYFIDYVGTENNEYTKAITKTWLTGAIARIYNPAVKFEIVPILEGKQGIGKSTVTRNLFPAAFNDSMDGLGTNKDDYQQLNGSWIIELAELSAMKKTDIAKMKNFISAQTDTYRNSYGKYSVPHPRKCVFIGTTNDRDYLKDATGERRFYPIRCGEIKPTKNVWRADDNDILQVLAEAKHWYDLGEPLYLDKDTLTVAKQYQLEAQAENPMKDTILEYLEIEVPSNWYDLSTSVRRSYVERMLDNGDIAGWLEDKLIQPTSKLDRTTPREIMTVVFKRDLDRNLSGSSNAEAKKIRLVLDNVPGWRRNDNVKINKKRVRGYVRDDY
ncbi:VapE domain-containing protein [Paucilactobacillus nenjiangensis]|jgi:predicted P-loop ATPase|uniref:VapE domain-containing protein n=1 Tax=Paucilactobacillus nenjiangensis TaxID=1296540 RepID=UPI003BB69084